MTSLRGERGVLAEFAGGAADVRGGIPGSTSVVRRPGAAERNPRGHQVRRRALEIVLGIAVPLALLGLWQAASVRGWIDERLYPRPTNIVRKAWDMKETGELWDSITATSWLMILGFVYGSAAGLVAGLAMGMSRWLRAALEPMLNGLYTVPKIALLGVMITIFGIGDAPKVALVAVTVFFFVWIATMAAAMAVAEGYQEAALSFGAGPWQLFRHVILPASLPQIFVGLRIAAGVTILVLVSAEGLLLNTSDHTVGGLIFGSRQLLLFERMYVGIVLAALLGVAFTLVVRWIGRLLMPWAPGDRFSRSLPGG